MTTPYTVPAQFRVPLMPPKRVPGQDYAQAMRAYRDEVERRFACVPPAPPREVETDEDDEYLSDEDTAGENDDDDDDDTDTDHDDPYYFEENPMKLLNHTQKPVSTKELQQKMPDDCCFCLEELLRANAVTTNCGHSFCQGCFGRYSKKNCPSCRQRLTRLTTYQENSDPASQDT